MSCRQLRVNSEDLVNRVADVVMEGMKREIHKQTQAQVALLSCIENKLDQLLQQLLLKPIQQLGFVIIVGRWVTWQTNANKELNAWGAEGTNTLMPGAQSKVLPARNVI